MSYDVEPPERRAERQRVARAIRNFELARSVKDGSFVDTRANMLESWFPIRPKIKKDQAAITRLYGDAHD
jgi:hypothetical protein